MPENNNPRKKQRHRQPGAGDHHGDFLVFRLLLHPLHHPGHCGLIQASKAKELGYDDAIRTAGFVLSLIGLIGGALAPLACAACVSCAGLVGVQSVTHPSGWFDLDLRAAARLRRGRVSEGFGMAPYLVLFGRAFPPTACWPGGAAAAWGYFHWRLRRRGRTPAGRSRPSSGGCWEPWWGQAPLPAAPAAPAGG